MSSVPSEVCPRCERYFRLHSQAAMVQCIAEQYKLVLADEAVWDADVKKLMQLFDVERERRTANPSSLV